MSQEDTNNNDASEEARTDSDTGSDDASRTDENGGDDAQRQTFDAEYVSKLRRENAAARRRAQEAEARAQEFEDRDKSEAQKLAERATAAEKRAEEYEQKLLRHEVAAAKGIPLKLADRLQGATREEMEQDADTLMEAVGTKSGNGAEGFDAGRRPGRSTTDMNELIRQRVGAGRS